MATCCLDRATWCPCPSKLVTHPQHLHIILDTKKVLTVSTSCALIYLVSYTKNIHTINISNLDPTDGQSFEYVPQEATDICPSFALMHARCLSPTPSYPQVAFSI